MVKGCAASQFLAPLCKEQGTHSVRLTYTDIHSTCKMSIKSCFMLIFFLLFINVTCLISGKLVLLMKMFSCTDFQAHVRLLPFLDCFRQAEQNIKVHYVDQQISSVQTASCYTPITFGV